MIDKFGKLTLESMNQADWYNKWTMNKIKSFLTGKILEIGCGIGNFTKTLLEFGQVYGIDIREDYVNETKKILKTNGAKIGLGDIEKGGYFFKDEKFDSIVCINVLEHVKDDTRALGNIYNLLKKSGLLILIIPAYPFLYGEIDKAIGHFRRYTKEDISLKLEEGGFYIQKFRTLNFIGAIGWFISGRILKNKIVDHSKIKFFNLLAPFFLKIEDMIEPVFGTSFLIIARKS